MIDVLKSFIPHAFSYVLSVGVYSIYDNILYYMENDDNMSLFKTNICTVVFDGSKYSYFCGVIDGEKESYINKYCNVLYNFFQQMYK